jgi:formylglycine-generating enzyme required for sulfatase activity
MADHYCRADRKRLPTEAQWEYAASGGGTRAFAWGDDAPDATRLNACGSECLAWVNKHRATSILAKSAVGDGKGLFGEDDGFATTAPVGSFPKGVGKFGHHDLAGNVWEWVDDRYAFYQRGAVSDPTGPAEGDERVVRGGDWTSTAVDKLRASHRSPMAPSARSYAIGFRCAMPITPPPPG